MEGVGFRTPSILNKPLRAWQALRSSTPGQFIEANKWMLLGMGAATAGVGAVVGGVLGSQSAKSNNGDQSNGASGIPYSGPTRDGIVSVADVDTWIDQVKNHQPPGAPDGWQEDLGAWQKMWARTHGWQQADPQYTDWYPEEDPNEYGKVRDPRPSGHGGWILNDQNSPYWPDGA